MFCTAEPPCPQGWPRRGRVSRGRRGAHAPARHAGRGPGRPRFHRQRPGHDRSGAGARASAGAARPRAPGAAPGIAHGAGRQPGAGVPRRALRRAVSRFLGAPGNPGPDARGGRQRRAGCPARRAGLPRNPEGAGRALPRPLPEGAARGRLPVAVVLRTGGSRRRSRRACAVPCGVGAGPRGAGHGHGRRAGGARGGRRAAVAPGTGDLDGPVPRPRQGDHGRGRAAAPLRPRGARRGAGACAGRAAVHAQPVHRGGRDGGPAAHAAGPPWRTAARHAGGPAAGTAPARAAARHAAAGAGRRCRQGHGHRPRLRAAPGGGCGGRGGITVRFRQRRRPCAVRPAAHSRCLPVPAGGAAPPHRGGTGNPAGREAAAGTAQQGRRPPGPMCVGRVAASTSP